MKVSVGGGVDFTQTYFELFGLTPSFDVDLALLAERYRHLQKELHPDKFAGKSAGEQRMAVQFAAQANTAYDVLQTPVLRAEYLLSLAGCPVNHDSTTLDDTAFLSKQMMWREALFDIKGSVKCQAADGAFEALENLMNEVSLEQDALLSHLRLSFKENQFALMSQAVAKLRFVEKILADIDELGQMLDEY